MQLTVDAIGFTIVVLIQQIDGPEECKQDHEHRSQMSIGRRRHVCRGECGAAQKDRPHGYDQNRAEHEEIVEYGAPDRRLHGNQEPRW